MANKPISEDNPFANLSDVQCEHIQNWYQKHISLTLTTLLKGSKSGQVIDSKLERALNEALKNSKQTITYKGDGNSPIKLQNASVLAELKDTRDLFHGAQVKINKLEQKITTSADEIQLLETQKSELQLEVRSLKQRLNHVLSRLESQGVSFQKSHYVGRILVHALRASFENWQQTPSGESFKNHDFYKLFPRVLYSSLLKEIEKLLGEHDYNKIERSLSDFVFQQKGSPVENWPDEDPIYETRLINQKQSELLIKLQSQHQQRKNFTAYLEKRLSNTGFTHKHSDLLMTLVEFATNDENSKFSSYCH
ncbi:hypothetical protein CWB77_01340 [Pseudoalteromonas sp. S1610]|uniref:hypothetical protein n=1 Tax=unclassified Pseudoalteromonas TaxID=194690 RepID=UPI00110A7D25|nr:MULTISPECIES: hypothetical protein [unclassified Pseudoalteromonas]MCK8125761.1 hypothetical protein [Pseudoalteromonas sp. 2CM39R]TMP63705.1 hypothetical protein CWB77_01340 [Pseudoalteromonas sp. S1610]